MIVKNTTNESRYYTFGKQVRGFTLKAGAQRFIPDSEIALNAATAYAEQGILAIIGGPNVTTVYTPAAVPASASVEFSGNAANGNTVTIDGIVFTFRTADDGDPRTVELKGSAAATAQEFLDVVNAYKGTIALNVFGESEPFVVGSDTLALLYSKRPGTLGNGALDTEAGTGHTVEAVGDNLAMSGAFSGGTNSTSSRIVTYETTVDGTPATLQVATGLRDVRSLFLNVRTSAGVPKTLDSEITIHGGTILITDDNGSSALANNDVVNILAIGE